jgi:hypothetical protein
MDEIFSTWMKKGILKIEKMDGWKILHPNYGWKFLHLDEKNYKKENGWMKYFIQIMKNHLQMEEKSPSRTWAPLFDSQ